MKGFMIEAQHIDGNWYPAYNPDNPLIPKVYTDQKAAERALTALLWHIPECIRNRFRITKTEAGK